MIFGVHCILLHGIDYCQKISFSPLVVSVVAKVVSVIMKGCQKVIKCLHFGCQKWEMGKKQNEKLNNNIEIKMGQFYVLTWNCNPSLLFDSNVMPVAAQAGPVLGLRY